MTKILIAILIISSIITSAQYAKIVDKDGYCNLREMPNSKGKIIKILKSNNIVFISNLGNDNQEWSKVVFQDFFKNTKSKKIEGFVHNSRLKKIGDFDTIPSVDSDDTGVSFNCCHIKVEIKTTSFDSKKNIKKFVKHNAYYTFKNKYAFGSWGVFPPKLQYSSISGQVKNMDLQIPISDIENLFEINNEEAFCYLDNTLNALYIVLNNSDGSSSYSAIFVVENGKYKGFLVNEYD